MKRFIFIVVSLVVLGGLIAWRFSVKAETAAQLSKSAPGRQAANVLLGKAVARDIVQNIEAVGTIESPYNVKLSPNIAGPITYLEVREGAHVVPGQVLVRIDPAEVEGAVLQQQAAVAEARQRLVQAQLTQNPTVVGVRAGIQQQQAGVTSAQADFGQVRQNYAAQIAAAESSVTDAKAKVAAAESQVENARANVASAQANLANAQVKYDRYETLYKQGFVASQDVDDQRTARDVQAAAVKVAQGAYDAAVSAKNSAIAQQHSAEKQVSVLRLKGVSDIAASKAKYEQAVASLNLAKANRAQEPAYQANLDALRASYDAAVAQYQQAVARRAYTVLKSPIEGIVTARSADPGAIASPGTPVLTLQFVRWVYLTSTIPVENSASVHIGQAVQFTIDALPGKNFVGQIAEINPSADAVNRQFTIRLKIDNSDNALRPGMYAKLQIETSRVHAPVVVPREAVTIKDDGSATAIQAAPSDNNQFVAHVTPVKLGAQDPTGIQILDGIEPGAQVVIQSYQAIRDGQKIRQGGGSGGGGGAGGKSGRKRKSDGAAGGSDAPSAPAGATAK